MTDRTCRVVSLGHGRARFWRGQLPLVPPIHALDPLERRFPVSAADAEVISSSVAAELHIHLGPRFLYGMLLGHFEPAGTDRVVRMEVAPPDGPPWPESMAASMEDVRFGMPMEYANATAIQLAAEIDRRRLPAGCMTANGAHGAVSSSVSAFRALAALLVHMLVERLEEGDEHVVASIVREAVARGSQPTLRVTGANT